MKQSKNSTKTTRNRLLPRICPVRPLGQAVRPAKHLQSDRPAPPGLTGLQMPTTSFSIRMKMYCKPTSVIILGASSYTHNKQNLLLVQYNSKECNWKITIVMCHFNWMVIKRSERHIYSNIVIFKTFQFERSKVREEWTTLSLKLVGCFTGSIYQGHISRCPHCVRGLDNNWVIAVLIVIKGKVHHIHIVIVSFCLALKTTDICFGACMS